MTDGPHYMTLEEATAKYCPHTMNGIIKDGSRLELTLSRCFGTQCMAWRWRTHYEGDGEDEGHVVTSTTHGYCGMLR